MPPPSLAMLLLKVLLIMVSVPELKTPPPNPAVLPLSVLLMIVSVAVSAFKMAPPSPP